MFIFLFWVEVEILSNNFSLEAHHFWRPGSVELFVLPKIRPEYMQDEIFNLSKLQQHDKTSTSYANSATSLSSLLNILSNILSFIAFQITQKHACQISLKPTDPFVSRLTFPTIQTSK